MNDDNSFILKTDAPASLNYLIYIQNAHLNSLHDNGNGFRFPYITGRPWEIAMKEQFNNEYIRSWNEIAENLSRDPSYDRLVFNEHEERLFRGLFENNPDGLNSFDESLKSFRAWWDSLAGRFAVERTVDRESEKTYTALLNVIDQEGANINRQLNLSLVYDEFPLGDISLLPNYAIVPVRAFLPPNNKEGLVHRLAECIR